jgi:NAD dependent epimerase/dehydratase
LGSDTFDAEYPQTQSGDDLKVLVTGADGFIGSHLTEALVRAGHDVTAFVIYNSLGSWGWLDHCSPDVASAFRVIAGDIRSSEDVRRAVGGMDAVLHLAALIAIPYSFQAPDAYIDTNVTGTLNVLLACRDAGVRRVVHTSTSEVYGSAQFVPITEAHPLHAQSPYAASKIGADQLAMSFAASYALPVTVIRPFNTFGPRQSARAVIPAMIGQLLSGATELRVGATHPTRDFTYVSDTVAGFIAALVSTAGVGDVANLGTGHEVTIGQTARVLMELIGHDVPIVTAAERIRPNASEVERLCADNGRAREWWGWAPSEQGEAGLRAGLSRTIEWFRDPRNLAAYRTSQYVV